MSDNERYKSPRSGAPLPRGKPFEPGNEAQEAGRKGGKKSAEGRAKRKTLREELLLLLSEKQEDGRTGQVSMSVSLLQQAIKGNVKAYEIIRDTIGEKPVEKVEQMIDVEYRESVEYVKSLVEEGTK